MPRKGPVARRDVLPDPIYKTKLVTRLINRLMIDGKRGVAQTILYNAFELVSYVHLHSRVAIPVASLNKSTFKEDENDKLLLTTVGKLIFNEILPETFPYINEPTDFNLGARFC